MTGARFKIQILKFNHRYLQSLRQFRIFLRLSSYLTRELAVMLYFDTNLEPSIIFRLGMLI